MREWHDWLGHDRGDSGDQEPDVPAESARGQPRSSEVIRDPETRTVLSLEQRERVDAAYEGYRPRHAKDQPESRARQGLAPDRTAPEAIPEHRTADPETRAALAAVEERSAALPGQAAKKAKPERSWLPSNATAGFAVGIGLSLSAVADYLNFMPVKTEELVTAFLGTVISGVAWGNQRWKDKHGDRSED